LSDEIHQKAIEELTKSLTDILKKNTSPDAANTDIVDTTMSTAVDTAFDIFKKGIGF
jgi:hypothetical protein